MEHHLLLHQQGPSNSIRGSPHTWHDHHQWSLAPLPSWKLYENPFFTEGQFVPKYVPRYLNAPSRRSTNSFTTAEAQYGPVLNSHHGPSHVLAPNSCVNKPHDSDAAPSQPVSAFPPPHSLSASDKFMPGTLVSARKLAASFWEHYGVHKLDQGEDEPCDQHSSCAQAQQLHLQALSNTLARPSMPSTCQIPEALEDTRGVCGAGEARENSMASSQAAATLENVLHRVRSVEESQSRSTAMLHKLRSEMGDVTGRIHELEFSHKLAMREINSLLQRFGEQMAISRRKEQEKARLAFLHLREEMEEERNACRLLKMQNKKLTKDLTHANIAAADACEELDRERKARGLLEEVCNELAREIGEDKAEVEQLKQEQKECRERLEKELKMMRMAALWGEDRVRSKLSEAQLELMDNNGKQGMPLHELRSKLEAFVSAVGGTCDGSQEEIQKQAEQAKLLTQALKLLELEESRRSQDDAEDFGSAVRSPACPNTCFLEENASSSAENELNGDEGNVSVSHGDTGTMNGIEYRTFVNETRKPRKGRRRMRASGKQRHNVGVRIYEQKNCDLWNTQCANSAWPSSEDEPDRRELNSLQNCTPYWKRGHALEGDAHAHNLHVNANSAVLNRNNVLLASSGHGRHTVLKEMRASVLAAASSGHISTRESCHLEQSLSNNSVGKESQKKHSASARFEIRTGGGEVDYTLEAEMGPSIQYSFSEDDAVTYVGSWDERREKEGKEDVREDKHHVRHPHDHLHILKSTGRGEKSAEDGELDNFCFESLREPANASNNKANRKEDGVNTERLDRGFSNCSDDACCGIMANCSQSCKDGKGKVHENAESITILASQELSNIEGSADVGGEETMSPWRSASTKPRPCFWPPSPDAFFIFGGAKKRSKACSPTPATSVDGEHPMNGLHPRDLHRHTSPAREALHQRHLVCVKSNSLGAQLIKARELETEKPAKPSFRFSPLRRATSHG